MPSKLPAADPCTDLRVAYRIIASSGDQPVIVLNSRFDLPHALEKEFLPLADASSAKLFELLVATPLQTGIRAFLQRRFEALRSPGKTHSEQEAQGPSTLEVQNQKPIHSPNN